MELDKNEQKNFINHLKASGFVYPGSEIYGGLANTWDYGPLGSIFLNNIKKQWIKEFIFMEKNNHLIDAKILMNPEVWKTSGHIANFSDPLIENKVNNKRYRADHMIKNFDNAINVDKMTPLEMETFIQEKITFYDNSKVQWTTIKKFNLMFETYQGVVEDNKNKIYLRPETAQAIFVNFKNVLQSTRAKLPMGIGQIGKSFRNEVTPGNFIFRTREFEQMELEFFSLPEQANHYFDYYLKKCFNFAIKMGINKDSLRIRAHEKEELSHYSKATSDIEYEFYFGWGELLGVANRADFDLQVHSKASKIDLRYFDPMTNTTYFPYVIEPSMGLDRMALAILTSSYVMEKIEDIEDSRLILKINKKLVPYQIAILPLIKKFNINCEPIIEQLKQLDYRVTYDENGSIGKRYRRQDSIGTYLCITFDYNSLEDWAVTIRERDSMKQTRIKISELNEYLNKELNEL